MAHNEMASLDAAADPKLPLLTSPLIRAARETPSNGPTPASTLQAGRDRPDLEDFGYRDGPAQQEIPEFQKHDEATAIEVFYDLFFAANLTVFSDVVDVTNSEKLATFVVYFTLLWFNWALLGLYDVRFITDSIFERAARAVHFGVMIGFAVICPNFSLSTQQSGTFQTMSVILMTSRLTMALQYGTILWYCRGYRRAKLPIAIMIGLNFVAGMFYLGLGFTFSGGNRSLYAVWFVITAVEICVSVALSLKWEVLSFQGTHLASRVSLLTFILMGEGLCLLGLGVVRIVQNANSWTPPTIGNVTAGVANIYIVFMIYFDWRRSLRLGKYKQLIWSFLHFPFHLAMRIFIEGSSQFVVWWKVFETIDSVNTKIFLEALAPAFNQPDFNVTTSWLVGQINGTITDVFNTYVPKYYDTIMDFEAGIEKLGEFPDSLWNNETITEESPEAQAVIKILTDLVYTVENSLLAGFKIDGFAGFSNTTLTEQQQETFQSDVLKINQGKYNLVFKYAYIAAGITLILMNVLFIITTSRRWRLFDYFQKTINFLVGVGLCLVSLITLDVEKYTSFASTPWPLPMLLLVFFAVLVLHHLPSPPPFLFGKGKKRKSATEGWEAVGYRHKASEEASEGHGSEQKVVMQTDTQYRGAGGQA